MNLKYLLLTLFLSLVLGANLHAQEHRCGTEEYMELQKLNDPSLHLKMQEIEKYTKARLKSEKSLPGIITIPVVFHIVHNPASPAQNLPDAQILSQLDVLNEDFRRMNADAINTPADFLGVASDVQIEFCLATVDPDGNPTTGITRTETERFFFVWPGEANDIKSDATDGKDAWPAGDYLNIWTGSIVGALGYSPYPGGDPAIDGVVIDYKHFGRGYNGGSFDLGRTCTHEVGHWLNLRHIWGDGDCSVDDLVSDTPTQGGPTPAFGSTCNYPGADSCDDGPGDLPDMFQNYMDYSKDACMNLFTQGQSDRMRVLFEPGGARESLLNSNGCGVPTCDLAVNAPTVTQPTCATPAGTIEVNATGNDVLEYSVDDGASWQASNSFAGLAPGDYNIKVRLEVNPTCMTAYSDNPVSVDPVPDPPTVACSSTAVQCDDFNGSSDDGTATAIPSGGAPPYTYLWDVAAGSQTAQTATNLAAGMYTVTVTDDNGCTNTCQATVAAASALTVVCSSTGETCPGTNDGTATATPSGGASPYDYLWDAAAGSQTSSTASGLVPGMYTVTVTDDNGCTNTCQATVASGSDNTDPIPNCNTTNINLTMAPGTHTFTQAEIDAMGAGSTDNCGSVTFSANPTTVDCSDGASATIVITVDDGNGNTADCNATVNINDPSFYCCPASVSISASPSGDICLGTMGVQYNANVTGGAPDAFAWCAYNNGTGSGNCFNGFNDNSLPNPTRNWTSSSGPKSVGVTVSQTGCPDVTDLYTFNVVKPAAPTPATTVKAFCHGDPNITPNLANTGVNVSNTLTGNERIVWELVSAPTNSDLATGFLNDNCAGSVTGTFDGELRIANSSKVVRVDDVSVMNNMGDPIYGDYVFNAYLKDCDLDCISDPVGTFTITVNEPFPTIICPPATTVECGSSLDPADTGTPTTPTNTCCTAAPVVSHNDVGAGGNCPVKDILTRTFTVAYADCNYTTTCDQIITIEDTTPPVVVTCPPDVTLEWPVGFNTQPVGSNTPQDPSIDPSNYANLVYTEVCGTVTIDYEDFISGPNPGACPILWTVTRTWTVTDECGLNTTCDQIFTFTDTTDPVINCPPPAPIEWPAGFNTADVGPNTPQDPSIDPAIYSNATATDNCGNPNITYQDDITGPNACPNLWTVTRTWTASDACGLTDVCVQTFTLTDTTPPSINTCPPPITVEGCSTADIMSGGLTALPFSTVLTDVSESEFNNEGGVASDNCSIVAWEFQDVASGASPIIVSRTWTVIDACGLVDVCTQVITIDDTTPPVLTCQNITVDLTPNGDLTITPSQVFDAIGSSDNCGTVTPVSVTPASFTCQNEGANSVTLTGADASGNQSTCTATVTIAAFFTTYTAMPTAESCAGAADGTINASATAGGGQMKYSIDGVNFQSVGQFANLTPGNYTVTFKVFGIPSVCQKMATVTVAAGPSSATWYKDNDNDGYSDGISQVSCIRPTGYKTSAELNGNTSGDCNDNDSNAFPGQTWYKDADNDNYTNGMTQVSCLRPAGYKTDAELVNIIDIDCNDNPATGGAVNHGATEVCNGMDDNCDNQIDEGLSGETYVGNISFSTQAQVNAWSACYSIINGNVSIVGAGVNNLSPLSNIVEITGNLTIQSTGLTSMNGLGSLANLGGTLIIFYNSSLTTVNGLGSLATVGGAFYMYYNFLLSDCCAIHDLINGGVTGTIVIFYNKVGCNSVAEINNNCGQSPIIGSPNGNGSQVLSNFSHERSMTLFPNPTKDNVTVKVTGRFDGGLLKVVDFTGRTIHTQALMGNDNNPVIQLGNWNAGVYFVQVQVDGEMFTQKLIVN